LAARRGYVLLLGVGLSACTAVHLGEELAGRRPFIRWVLYTDGTVRRVREYGCSDAFGRLAPCVEALAQRCTIGACRVACYRMAPFVATLSEAIRATPEITLCGRADCRCVASAGGGPLEEDQPPEPADADGPRR
ncbi:MAG: AAC(3) family N-acetyltransferase, partial [Candidatus Latescibacterota bacterium]